MGAYQLVRAGFGWTRRAWRRRRRARIKPQQNIGDIIRTPLRAPPHALPFYVFTTHFMFARRIFPRWRRHVLHLRTS